MIELDVLTAVAAKATNTMGGRESGILAELRISSQWSSLNQGSMMAFCHGWNMYRTSIAFLKIFDLYIALGGRSTPCVNELVLLAIERVSNCYLLHRGHARINC